MKEYSPRQSPEIRTDVTLFDGFITAHAGGKMAAYFYAAYQDQGDGIIAMSNVVPPYRAEAIFGEGLNVPLYNGLPYALFVDPSFRGQKLATRLIRAFGEEVREVTGSGVIRMRVKTTPQSISYFVHAFDAHPVPDTGKNGGGITATFVL